MKKNADPICSRFPSPLALNDLSREEKIARISVSFREIMITLGLDVTNQSLAQTPLRVAKMYVDDVFTGLDPKSFPESQMFEEEAICGDEESLVVSRCSFSSFCEHHFVPMTGIAYVGYIPRGKLIGLSKIHRLVRFFSARPQLQERLSAQIADSLANLTGSDDVAVSIEAVHSCVHLRGVRDQKGCTLTNFFSGVFKTDAARLDEFLRAIDRLKE